jgi:DNA-binding MarR family transcriptional regulator
VANGIEDGLEDLLGEVMSVAVSLRRSAGASRGFPGLSLPARSALKLLQGHSGLTVPQLARQRGTSRQNIQVLVDRLEGAGLVQYVTNPDHQRSDRLQLTSTGSRALSAANSHLAARLGGLLPDLSGEELQSCLALLARIREALAGGTPTRRPPGVSPSKGGKPVRNPAPAPKVGTSIRFPEDLTSDASPPETLPVNLL